MVIAHRKARRTFEICNRASCGGGFVACDRIGRAHRGGVDVFLVGARFGYCDNYAAGIDDIPNDFFLSMIPVTVTGWGVRELVLISALGLVGISAQASVALGIAFGVLMLVLSVPGALVWMFGRWYDGFRSDSKII